MYKHSYDQFFERNFLTDEDIHLHYIVPEFRNPKKIRIKAYNEDGNIEFKDFLVPTKPEPVELRKCPSVEGIDENYVATGLLEVPISRIRREILDEIAEKQQIQSELREFPLENEQKPDIIRENLLWTDKYMPQHYFELLSDDKINREVLTWLKTWDPIAFRKRLQYKQVFKKKETILKENQKSWEM